MNVEIQRYKDVISEEILSNIFITVYDCWVLNLDFYRKMKSKNVNISRGYIYKICVGEIPKDKYLDNCGNRFCINPSHFILRDKGDKNSRKIYKYSEEYKHRISGGMIKRIKTSLLDISNKCFYCGRDNELTLDHTIPLSWKYIQNFRGDKIIGLNNFSPTSSMNCTLICNECNKKKGGIEAICLYKFMFLDPFYDCVGVLRNYLG